VQLRDRYEELASSGVNVVAIGMGWPGAAAAFRDEMRIPFPLLVDHTKETYRLLDIGRASWNDLVGPKVWARGVTSLARGHKLKPPRQDVHQLGGAAVILPGSELALVHRAKSSADNIPLDDLFRALP